MASRPQIRQGILCLRVNSPLHSATEVACCQCSLNSETQMLKGLRQCHTVPRASASTVRWNLRTTEKSGRSWFRADQKKERIWGNASYLRTYGGKYQNNQNYLVDAIKYHINSLCYFGFICIPQKSTLGWGRPKFTNFPFLSYWYRHCSTNDFINSHFLLSIHVFWMKVSSDKQIETLVVSL